MSKVVDRSMTGRFQDSSELASVPASDVKVLVGITGRLDSMVAAFLLKKQGHHVMGLGISLWDGDALPQEANDFQDNCSVGRMEELKVICESIDIPFYAVNAHSEYQERVVGPMVAATLGGDLPHPCYDCVPFKLDILYSKMKTLGADFIATGHYAKLMKNHNTGDYVICASNDLEHDQSPLMANVAQPVLRKLLLPLAELRRTEAEKIAKNFDITVRPSRPERGPCYIQSPGYRAFVELRSSESLREAGPLASFSGESYFGDHGGIHGFYPGMRNIEVRGNTESNFEVLDIDAPKRQVFVGTPEENRIDGAVIYGISVSREVDLARPLPMFLRSDTLPGAVPVTVYFKSNLVAWLVFAHPVMRLFRNSPVVLYHKDKGGGKALITGKVGKVMHRVGTTPTPEELVLQGSDFQF